MMLIPKPGYVRRLSETKTRIRKVAFELADEIKVVMAHYDLGPWQVCDVLPGGNSYNIAIQTRRGKKLLKQYYWDLPSALQEHSILRHLAETDFPSPQLVINRNSLTYTEVADKHYAIYDFVNGYRYTNYFMLPKTRRRLVAQAGKILAQFHQLVAGLVLEGRKFNGFMPDGKRLWRDVNWHLNVVENYVESALTKPFSNPQEKFLLSIVDQLKGDMVEVGRHYERADLKLPKSVIHADLSPQNLMIDRQGIAAVLDFGDACVNLRALDVARAVTSFSNLDKDGFDQDLAGSFLWAYQTQQPLLDAEIEAIPDLIRWRHLRNIVWSIFSQESPRHRKARDNHFDTIRRKWDENCWVKTHTNQMRESFYACVNDR
jgi:Ser/Thr protein kinase RdoA (MazF antagonist)